MESLLRQVSFFRNLDRVEIARLVGALQEFDMPAGATIIQEGAEADGLYLLSQGQVRVSVKAGDGEKELAKLAAPAQFGAPGLLVGRRTSTVRAISDVRVWKLPRERFEQLVRERPALALAVAGAAVEQLEGGQRQLVGAPALAPYETQKPMLELRRPSGPVHWRIAGGFLAVSLPILLWPVGPPSGLNAQGWHAGLILVGAALAWLFEPIPDFLVALLMAAAWGIAGLAPPSVSFAGFTSASWFVALATLILAVIMTRTGLLLRAALLLLRIFPANYIGQTLGLLTAGVLSTPLMPLATARVAAVAPLTTELIQTLRYPPKSPASAGLAFAGLIGYGSFGSVFLTGLVVNFFLIDLLPPADRAHFGWMTWFLNAAPAGLAFFVGATIALLILFRPRTEPLGGVAERRQRVAGALGRLTRGETVTLGAVAILVVGMLLQPVIHVDSAWLAIAALSLAVAGSGVPHQILRASIDWPFLIWFGVMLGTGGVLQRVGLDGWVADGLAPVARLAGAPGALMLLAVLVVVCRLVLPAFTTRLLLSLVFVPAAPALGLSPWLAGVVIFTAASPWIHPGQSEQYQMLRSASSEELFSVGQGLMAGLAMTLVTLASIAVTIPYWRAIGLLSP